MTYSHQMCPTSGHRLLLLVGAILGVLVSAPSDLMGQPSRRKQAAVDEEDRANAATLEKLEQKVDVEFLEASLEDVLDHFKKTHDLQCYLDLNALVEADVEVDQPTITLQLKGVPLRVALSIILQREDLTYMLNHGILKITTVEVASLAENLVCAVYEVGDLVEPERPRERTDQAKVQEQETRPKPAQTQSSTQQSTPPGNVHTQAGRVVLPPMSGTGPQPAPRTAAPYDIQTLADVVTRAVDPDSWDEAGGGFATIHPYRGTLVVTQTIQNHRKIERLLEHLRRAVRQDRSAAPPEE